VAVVGGGPAGLSAAWHLRREGCRCVLLDEHPEPGGQLRRGVDRERLPLDVLDAEIAAIMRMGVEFRGGIRIADRSGLESLLKQFDAVLMACGETGSDMALALGLPFGDKGFRVDHRTLAIGTGAVYAAGSAVAPSNHAVRAVASGRRAALSIAMRLRGEPGEVEGRPYTVHMGRLHDCEIPLVRGEGSPDGRVEPAGGKHAGFDPGEMRRETARCLHCDCLKVHNCDLRRCAALYGASTARFRGERRQYEKESTHPDLVYEPGKCIDCGRCVAIAARAGEKLGVTYFGRGFTMRIKVPFDSPVSEGLAVAARECAGACPTAALTWHGKE
jgi:ferredoxin